MAGIRLMLLCFMLFPAAGARAVIYTVNPDGTGHSTTIQGGIDLAVSGDRVYIVSGTYYESGITVDGKDIIVAYASATAPAPIVKSPAPGSGTAFILRNVTSSFWLFYVNIEGFETGVSIESGSPLITDCSLKDNATGIYVGAGSSSPSLSRNVIENFTTAVAIEGGAVSLRNHTIVEGGTGISVSGGTVDAPRNIIYRCLTGAHCAGGSLALSCNDLWENTADYSGCVPGTGDIYQMPRFCYEATTLPGLYYLHVDSPCWAANNPCGANIGALTNVAGCSGTAASEASWGSIKGIFRE